MLDQLVVENDMLYFRHRCICAHCAACHGSIPQHLPANSPFLLDAVVQGKLLPLALASLPPCSDGAWRVAGVCWLLQWFELPGTLSPEQRSADQQPRVCYIDIYPWSTGQCVSHITCTGLTWKSALRVEYLTPQPTLSLQQLPRECSPGLSFACWLCASVV